MFVRVPCPRAFPIRLLSCDGRNRAPRGPTLRAQSCPIPPLFRNTRSGVRKGATADSPSPLIVYHHGCSESLRYQQGTPSSCWLAGPPGTPDSGCPSASRLPSSLGTRVGAFAFFPTPHTVILPTSHLALRILPPPEGAVPECCPARRSPRVAVRGLYTYASSDPRAVYILPLACASAQKARVIRGLEPSCPHRPRISFGCQHGALCHTKASRPDRPHYGSRICTSSSIP